MKSSRKRVPSASTKASTTSSSRSGRRRLCRSPAITARTSSSISAARTRSRSRPRVLPTVDRLRSTVGKTLGRLRERVLAADIDDEVRAVIAGDLHNLLRPLRELLVVDAFVDAEGTRFRELFI